MFFESTNPLWSRLCDIHCAWVRQCVRPCVNVQLCLSTAQDPWASLLLSKKHYSGDYTKSLKSLDNRLHTMTMTERYWLMSVPSHTHPPKIKTLLWKCCLLSRWICVLSQKKTFYPSMQPPLSAALFSRNSLSWPTMSCSHNRPFFFLSSRCFDLSRQGKTLWNGRVCSIWETRK